MCESERMEGNGERERQCSDWDFSSPLTSENLSLCVCVCVCVVAVLLMQMVLSTGCRPAEQADARDLCGSHREASIQGAGLWIFFFFFLTVFFQCCDTALRVVPK